MSPVAETALYGSSVTATVTKRTRHALNSVKAVKEKTVKLLSRPRDDTPKVMKLQANRDAYPVWQPISVCVIFLGCCAVTAADVAAEGTNALFRVGLVFAVTFCLTDVLSGLLHIVLDNPFFAEKENWYGVIQPFAVGFQEHHIDTTSITTMPVIEHIRPMSFPLLGNFLVGCLLHGKWRYFAPYQVAISLGLALMQMGHRWAHAHKDQRPWGVTTLQNWGVLISPKAHLRHHKAPYATQFCIMSGTMNPLLNAIVKRYKPTENYWAWVFSAVVLTPHFALMALA